MIKKAFTVFDEKASVFMLPFFETTIGQATRAFSDAVNTDDHPFNRHPGDYTLFEIGTYDDNSGNFTNLDTPRSLGLALQFLGIDFNADLSTKPVLAATGN